MRTSYSAKAIISVENDMILLAAGKRGTLSPIGGGINRDDATVKDAFLREANEEANIEPHHLSDPKELIDIAGWTTNSEGLRSLTSWTVFTANLLVGSNELVIPDDSEITALTTMHPEEYLKLHYPYASMLGQRAVNAWLMGKPESFAIAA